MNEQTKLLLEMLEKYNKILTNPKAKSVSREEAEEEFKKANFEDVDLEDIKTIVGELCLVIKFIIQEQAKKEDIVEKFCGKLEDKPKNKKNYYT